MSGICCVGAAIGYLSASPDNQTRQVDAGQTASKLSQTESQHATPANDQSQLAFPSTPAAPLSAKLQRELLDSTDWRAFALSASRRPSEGGYLYAMYVSNLCGMDVKLLKRSAQDRAKKTIASTGTISSHQVRLVDELDAKCSAFTEGEAGKLVSSLRAASSDGLDPLVNANRSVIAALKNKDSVALRSSMQDLLNQSDSLAISSNSILELVSRSDAGAKEVLGYWFDGKIYSEANPSTFTKFNLGLQLAECSAGMPCTLQNQVMLACMSGNCYENPAAYVKAEFVGSGGKVEQFSDVLVYSQAIQRAIQDKDVNAFIRPN